MRRALLLVLCIGCVTTSIPGPDGGTAGGTAGGSAGGSSGGSAGGTAGGSAGGSAGGPSCTNLDEATCRTTAGCVADQCFTCSCTPDYQGCRRVNATPLTCPLLDCASPFCCHQQSDCVNNGTSCAAPGTPTGCGACRIDPGDCTDDTQCGAGSTCQPMPCSCMGAKLCAPGCSASSPCDDGFACSGGAHPRCVEKTCSKASDCAIAGFDCSAGQCVRRACSADADCGPAGAAYCVLGSCYRGLGVCRLPVP
ncbi:MAG: hypothetical protein IPJ65_28165 [Archangiaceae bacterium]|nr:hypothetical protein [Archangiaceae bacterium]